MKKIYIINGKNIVDLKSLFSEFARVVNAPGGYFGKCYNHLMIAFLEDLD